MTKRLVFAVVVIGLPLAAVVMSIAALVLIPLAIAVLPLAFLFAVAALPAILLQVARVPEPATVSETAAPARPEVPATAA